MMASEDVNLDPGQMVETDSSNASASLEKEDVIAIQDEVNKPVLSPDDDEMETVSLDAEKNTDTTDSNLESVTKELLNERDKLSAELTEKTSQLNAFETELSSLKSKVEALETEKSQILADHEKLHLQNESLNVKVNEVKKLYLSSLSQVVHVLYVLVEEALHRCEQRKGVHGGEVCHRRKGSYSTNQGQGRS